jgi:hypothetical protein
MFVFVGYNIGSVLFNGNQIYLNDLEYTVYR